MVDSGFDCTEGAFMNGGIIKLKQAELYLSHWSDTAQHWSRDRHKAHVFPDVKKAVHVAHDVGGVVLARHEVFDER